MGNEFPLFSTANGPQEGSNYDEIIMQHSLHFSDSLKVIVSLIPFKLYLQSPIHLKQTALKSIPRFHGQMLLQIFLTSYLQGLHPPKKLV
nr:uncharacterized protein LOC117275064 isoform X3 [Nicotiana tomentosiformis]